MCLAWYTAHPLGCLLAAPHPGIKASGKLQLSLGRTTDGLDPSERTSGSFHRVKSHNQLRGMLKASGIQSKQWAKLAAKPSYVQVASYRNEDGYC